MPVVEPTVATAVLLLLHMPPGVTSLSVVEKPGQTLVVPVIDAGFGFTVTGETVLQPVGKLYVNREVPVDKPVTNPVVALTEIEDPLVLQTPPEVRSE